MISAIVAVDNQGAIGKKGQLLCKIPADMSRFRRLTMGKTIILGRKTLATFPGGKPLEGRRNIILSRDPHFRCPGAEVYHSIGAVLARLKQLKDEDEFFVVGGESIYRQFNGHLDRIYLTRILTTFPGADAFFQTDGCWTLAEIGMTQKDEQSGIQYVFEEYDHI